MPCTHDFFVTSQYTRRIAKSPDESFFLILNYLFKGQNYLAVESSLPLSVFKLSVNTVEPNFFMSLETAGIECLFLMKNVDGYLSG